MSDVRSEADLRERVADALAHNDACGPGPVSRGEYLADADALIALIAPASEAERLRMYARHRDDCSLIRSIVSDDTPRAACSCGFDAPVRGRKDA